MGKGTKDIACFPKGSKKLKKRKVEDYKINCPIVKYDPQTVRNSLAKVFTISINITFKCFTTLHLIKESVIIVVR